MKPRGVLLFILLALLFLPGCVTAGGPQAVAACAAEMARDDDGRLSVFFVTNREPSGRPQNAGFSHRRSDRLTYGRGVLAIPPLGPRRFGSLEGFSLDEVATFPTSRALLAALEADPRTRSSGTALVYSHGYNEGLQKSLFRFGQFVHDGCLKSVPILFSWPSRGTLLGHSYDQDSAAVSHDEFADLVRLVLRSEAFDDVDVMAHSMGNSVAMPALEALSAEQGGPAGERSRVRTVILASPDVDIEAFRQLLEPVRQSAEQVFLLVSAEDRLLALSRLKARGRPRAGDASEAELRHYGIAEQGNFKIIRMDDAATGPCPALGHRCATANAHVVGTIKILFEAPAAGL